LLVSVVNNICGGAAVPMGLKGMLYSCSEVRLKDLSDGMPGPGITSGYAATRGSTPRNNEKRRHKGTHVAIKPILSSEIFGEPEETSTF
jgi:hypothetical protein